MAIPATLWPIITGSRTQNRTMKADNGSIPHGSRFFREPREKRPRQRLDAALHQPDHDRQSVELPSAFHPISPERGRNIGAEADGDPGLRAKARAEMAEGDGGGKTDKLRDQQREDELLLVEAESHAVVERHARKSADPVDIEQVGK